MFNLSDLSYRDTYALYFLLIFYSLPLIQLLSLLEYSKSSSNWNNLKQPNAKHTHIDSPLLTLFI